MKTTKAICAICCLSVSAAVPAQLQAASPVTTNLDVRIEILDSCTVATPATLDFGQQTALTANLDQATNLQVTCSLTTPYDVALGQGLHGTGVTDRKMEGSSTDQVAYALYSNSGRTQNWGETSGTDTIAGVGTGLAIAHTVYGRVPIQTTPRPDVYTDTVTVTVSY